MIFFDGIQPHHTHKNYLPIKRLTGHETRYLFSSILQTNYTRTKYQLNTGGGHMTDEEMKTITK